MGLVATVTTSMRQPLAYTKSALGCMVVVVTAALRRCVQSDVHATHGGHAWAAMQEWSSTGNPPVKPAYTTVQRIEMVIKTLVPLVPHTSAVRITPAFRSPGQRPAPWPARGL